MKCGQLYAQTPPNAVTLYWCKPKNVPIRAIYSIFLDGQQAGSAYRTHLTLEHLEPDRPYQLEVKLDGQSLDAICPRTRPAFHRLDVRGFGASGDGKTTDTAALQKAIDTCGPQYEVYLPAGYSSLLNLGELDHASGPNCRNVHMIYSRDIVTDHCTFISEGVWNGDGRDPDSSKRCVLFGCRFRTGDDCVAIKSGKNPEGNLTARPSKAIRVFDCSCGLGRGICAGSEISAA